jgi:hypothetical protein
MRRTCLVLWCGFFCLLALMPGLARGQTNEFVVKRVRQYWQDQNKQPWNDLTYRMAVRIDPQYAKALGADEIASSDSAIKYTTGWQYYTLQSDSKGTYADVDYLVYKDRSDPVVYQIELQKNGKAPPFVNGSVSKVEVRNDSTPPRPLALDQANAIFLKDWLIIGAVLLLGLILVYILVFRWLFSGLLFKRQWAVTSAEHFTWSMSLLIMLGIATALTWFYLGPRLETFTIIAIMGGFWLLHAIVWLVSGKEA